MRDRRGVDQSDLPLVGEEMEAEKENARRDKVCKNITDNLRAIVKLKYFSLRTVFDDFCVAAMASLHNVRYSLENKPVPAKYRETHDRLENDYAAIYEKYDKQCLRQFADALSTLLTAMMEAPYDYIGHIFERLRFCSKIKRQIFTPWKICEFMALIGVRDNEAVEDHLKEEKPVRVQDLACGPGRMMLAAAKVFKENYGSLALRENFYAELTGTDLACVRMAYINMALIGVMARVFWSDVSNNNEEMSYFDTPRLQELLGRYGNQGEGGTPSEDSNQGGEVKGDTDKEEKGK
jgi:type I restriction-modification system DNA methylase subunit